MLFPLAHLPLSLTTTRLVAARRLLCGLLGLGLLLGRAGGLASSPAETVAGASSAHDDDPLATARASIGQTTNPGAGVPPQCYTHTAGESNPCWTCHTEPTAPNTLVDWPLQEDYALQCGSAHQPLAESVH